MIIWSVHFHCCAMRIRAIPSPFQRHFNARQRFSFPLLTSAFLCCSIAGQCEAEQVPCFPSLTPASPLRFCTRRLFTLPFLCPAGLRGTMPLRSSARPCSSSRSYSFAILLKSLRPVAFATRHQPSPCPCVSVRGDSLLCHSFAILCQTVLCQTVLCLASAALCTTPPCRCFSKHIKTTHFNA